VGFAAVALALVLGVTLGLIAGYVGGWVETVIMRVADVQLTFPAILVAMLIFGIAKGITPPEYRDQMAIWVLILAIGLATGCSSRASCAARRWSRSRRNTCRPRG
jgi:peptide/nickel transport system permease protein